MTVTVAIPVFNKIDYLEECISSLINQTTSDFKLVLIDDGSTDGSGELCDAISDILEWVSVYHFENGGPFMARRRALDYIEDGYVVFLDADDYLRSDAIELIKGTIDRSNGADIIAFEMTPTEKHYEIGEVELDDNEDVECDIWSIEKARVWLLEGHSNALWCKAIKRSCFDSRQDYQKYCELKHGEDLLQSLFVFDKAQSFCYLHAKLYCYRKNCGGETASYQHKQLNDIRIVLDELTLFSLKWTGSTKASAIGSLIQYCSLFSLLGESKLGKDELQRERDTINTLMKTVVDRDPSSLKSLKPHNVLIVKSVVSENYLFAHTIAKSARVAKSILRG